MSLLDSSWLSAESRIGSQLAPRVGSCFSLETAVARLSGRCRPAENVPNRKMFRQKRTESVGEGVPVEGVRAAQVKVANLFGRFLEMTRQSHSLNETLGPVDRSTNSTQSPHGLHTVSTHRSHGHLAQPPHSLRQNSAVNHLMRSSSAIGDSAHFWPKSFWAADSRDCRSALMAIWRW